MVTITFGTVFFILSVGFATGLVSALWLERKIKAYFKGAVQ